MLVQDDKLDHVLTFPPNLSCLILCSVRRFNCADPNPATCACPVVFAAVPRCPLITGGSSGGVNPAPLL